MPLYVENQYTDSIQISLTSIRKQLRSSSSITSNTSNCSIYRVPERLRSINEKAYTPRVVSIGPFHHGNHRLRAMEEEKRRYLDNFLKRTENSSENSSDLFLEDCILKVGVAEGSLRSCYADNIINITSDEFVMIIAVDAIFIIELLLIFHSRSSSSGSNVERYRIFSQPWMIVDVWPDLLLLENQVPFFILQNLFDLLPANQRPSSLISLSKEFFAAALHAVGAEHNKIERSISGPVLHFLNFVRLFCVPVKAEENSTHDGKRQSTTLPCISRLHRAGVNFKKGSTPNLFDIRFDDGTLEIPKLEISDVTEIIIRNLIALEECHEAHDPWNNMISAYALIMDRFVNTSKDVELLVERGIFENKLGDDSEVATMINTLGSGVSAMGRNFYYGPLYEKLNAHCKKPWNTWKANLRQIYFNTPWTAMKVIAAVVLLILTLIQTVCSIMSLT